MPWLQGDQEPFARKRSSSLKGGNDDDSENQKSFNLTALVLEDDSQGQSTGTLLWIAAVAPRSTGSFKWLQH
jgi:hypothetical protein